MFAVDADPKVKIRLGYGTTFSRVGAIKPMNDQYWTHIFQVSLTPPIANFSDPFEMPKCQNSTNACRHFRQLIAQINNFKASTLDMIQEIGDKIKIAIPETRVKKRTRVPRTAILPIIGDLASTLFGTARQSDVEHLASVINAISKQTTTLTHNFKAHTQTFTSYITQANKQFNLMATNIKSNHQAIEDIIGRFKNANIRLSSVITDFQRTILDCLQKYFQIHDKVYQFYYGMSDIIKHRLSPMIIDSALLTQTLQHIDKKIKESSHGESIAYLNPTFYYNSVKVQYARQGNSLFITLKIPITMSQDILQLYKIDTYALPINQTSNDATKIHNLPDYFAVSHEHQTPHYLELSQYQLQTCTGDLMKICEGLPALRPFAHNPTCTAAIYTQKSTLVKQLCDFRYIHNGLQTNVIYLPTGELLLSNVNKVSVTCTNGHVQTLTGCKFCVIKRPPCSCYLFADFITIPPKIKGCSKRHKSVSKLYTVNLGLLQMFFSSAQLKDLAADTLLDDPLNVSIPHFHFVNNKYSSIVAQERQNQLSLNTIVEQTKQQNAVFQSMSDLIMAGHVKSTSFGTSMNEIITYLSVALSVITIPVLIYAVIKINQLSAALLVLQLAKPANTAKFIKNIHSPYLRWTDSPLPRPTHKPVSVMLYDTAMDHSSMILISLIATVMLAYVMFKITKFLCRKSSNTTLGVRIANGKGECCKLKLLKLNLCPADYQMPTRFHKVKIQLLHRFMWTKVSFHWPADLMLTCKNECNIMNIEFPEQVYVFRMTGIKLNHILSEDHGIKLFWMHHGQEKHVDIMQPTENQMQVASAPEAEPGNVIYSLKQENVPLTW